MDEKSVYNTARKIPDDDARYDYLKAVCRDDVDALKRFADGLDVITYEFEKSFVVNVYTPNSQGGLKRLPYRYDEWDPDYRKYLNKLAKKKQHSFQLKEMRYRPKIDEHDFQFKTKHVREFIEAAGANPDELTDDQIKWWTAQMEAAADDVDPVVPDH